MIRKLSQVFTNVTELKLSTKLLCVYVYVSMYMCLRICVYVYMSMYMYLHCIRISGIVLCITWHVDTVELDQGLKFTVTDFFQV